MQGSLQPRKTGISYPYRPHPRTRTGIVAKALIVNTEMNMTLHTPSTYSPILSCLAARGTMEQEGINVFSLVSAQTHQWISSYLCWSFCQCRCEGLPVGPLSPLWRMRSGGEGHCRSHLTPPLTPPSSALPSHPERAQHRKLANSLLAVPAVPLSGALELGQYGW